MIELPIIATSSLLGSSHCVGMCGPLAAMVGHHAESWKMNLLRQFIYSGGRIFTYSVLGAAAGALSERATSLSGRLPWIPAMIAACAGVLLIKEGLQTAGIRWRVKRHCDPSPAPRTSIIKTLLISPSLLGTFLAGLFTGFLPCGLVYAFLALAVQAGSLLGGLVTMLVFGMCTVPVMVATGCSVSLVSSSRRRHFARLAGWGLVLAGVISLARGWGYLPTHRGAEPGCPLCTESTAHSIDRYSPPHQALRQTGDSERRRIKSAETPPITKSSDDGSGTTSNLNHSTDCGGKNPVIESVAV